MMAASLLHTPAGYLRRDLRGDAAIRKGHMSLRSSGGALQTSQPFDGGERDPLVFGQAARCAQCAGCPKGRVKREVRGGAQGHSRTRIDRTSRRVLAAIE